MPLDPQWPPSRAVDVMICAELAVVVSTSGGDDGEGGGSSTAELRREAEHRGQVPPHLGCSILSVGDLLMDDGEDTIPSMNGGVHDAAEQQGGTMLQGGTEQRGKPLPLPWCYVLFTSGSTGPPLGVKGTEQGVLNRCLWMQHQGLIHPGSGCCVVVPPQHLGQQRQDPIHPGNGSCCVVAVKTAVSFVDSIWEAFAPLLLPASAVILPPSLILRPALLVEALREHHVTHFAAVPSLLRLMQPALVAAAEEEARPAMSGSAPQAGLNLQVVVSSGEPLSRDLASGLLKALPKGCRLLNLYGGRLSYKGLSLSGASGCSTSMADWGRECRVEGRHGMTQAALWSEGSG